MNMGLGGVTGPYMSVTGMYLPLPDPVTPLLLDTLYTYPRPGL